MNKYIYRFETEEEFSEALYDGLTAPIVIYIDETQSVLYNDVIPQIK